jgi:hypothetical protein
MIGQMIRACGADDVAGLDSRSENGSEREFVEPLN